MKQLAVHYCGWGEDWLLGLLADDGATLLFEYAPEAWRRDWTVAVASEAARPAYGIFRRICIGCPA